MGRHHARLAIVPGSFSAAKSVETIDPTARLRSVVGMRAFGWTLATFVAAMGFSWVKKMELAELWLAPVRDAATGAGLDGYLADESIPFFFLKVTVVTALLLTLPVFFGEAWLLICRRAHRDDARRLAIPFSVLSTAGVLVALWFVRQFEWLYLVGFVSHLVS